MYNIGQQVYTAKDIKGWFDYSLSDVIPANTVGTIIDYCEVGGDLNSIVYLVKFNKEFGTCQIVHRCLKLG